MAFDVLHTVIVAAWVMLPAYFANSSATFAGGWGVIDRGARLDDGRRVLGDGKTWSGLLGGTSIGTVAGVALQYGRAPFVRGGLELPTYGDGIGVVALPLATAVGALLGDVAASFAKRRAGKERGEPWPLVDQLDFVAGALGLAAATSVALGNPWFFDSVTAPVLVVILVLTPLIHLGANAAGYRMGTQEVPW